MSGAMYGSYTNHKESYWRGYHAGIMDERANWGKPSNHVLRPPLPGPLAICV